MASSCKSTETQLLALYRLEFSRNKMDWKLYDGARKKPLLSPKNNRKLNKTYNIGKDFTEPGYKTELISTYNKIFLDEEPECHLELKPAEDPLDFHLEYRTPAQVRQTAEDWLTLHGVPVRQEELADTFDEGGFEDESADFLRGAHTAPHSSETDLSVAQECPCTHKNSLCVMSVRQLARAIQRHHAALTLLLREQALRETLCTRSLLHVPIPFEDYPTRDTDPLRAPDSVLSSAPSAYCVLSASRHDAYTGRGHRSLEQHSAIGIGKGKPYWL